MKARVKETGETFVVYGVVNKTCDGYAIGEVELFVDDNDSFQYDMTPAYWEKLKHQAAISAMRGMLSNERCWEENADKIAEVAICYAKELIKGLIKEK